MDISRRKVIIAVPLFVASACTRSLPTEPTPQPKPTPLPVTPTSPWGTFYKSGVAGIEGTLEEVLRAARLNPEVTSQGLMTSLDGRLAQLVPAMDLRGYIFQYRGQWFSNGVRGLILKPGEVWDLFDWNGKNPPGNLARIPPPIITVNT